MKTISEFLNNHWLKLLLLTLILILSVLFLKREQIAENKVVKAKMEMMKALNENDMEKARAILDSLEF